MIFEQTLIRSSKKKIVWDLITSKLVTQERIRESTKNLLYQNKYIRTLLRQVSGTGLLQKCCDLAQQLSNVIVSDCLTVMLQNVLKFCVIEKAIFFSFS